MNTEPMVTRVMPGKRRARERKLAPRVTLHMGCVICGSRAHDKARCSMRIEDERGGVS